MPGKAWTQHNLPVRMRCGTGYKVVYNYSILIIQAKHAEGLNNFGVDGDTGKVVDMREYGLLESASVKIQTLKTAIEVCPVLSLSYPLRTPLYARIRRSAWHATQAGIAQNPLPVGAELRNSCSYAVYVKLTIIVRYAPFARG